MPEFASDEVTFEYCCASSSGSFWRLDDPLLRFEWRFATGVPLISVLKGAGDLVERLDRKIDRHLRLLGYLAAFFWKVQFSARLAVDLIWPGS